MVDFLGSGGFWAARLPRRVFLTVTAADGAVVGDAGEVVVTAVGHRATGGA